MKHMRPSVLLRLAKPLNECICCTSLGCHRTLPEVKFEENVAVKLPLSDNLQGNAGKYKGVLMRRAAFLKRV